MSTSAGSAASCAAGSYGGAEVAAGTRLGWGGAEGGDSVDGQPLTTPSVWGGGERASRPSRRTRFDGAATERRDFVQSGRSARYNLRLAPLSPQTCLSLSGGLLRRRTGWGRRWTRFHRCLRVETVWWYSELKLVRCCTVNRPHRFPEVSLLAVFSGAVARCDEPTRSLPHRRQLFLGNPICYSASRILR